MGFHPEKFRPIYLVLFSPYNVFSLPNDGIITLVDFLVYKYSINTSWTNLSHNKENLSITFP